ncbi:hypothetical protein KKH59_00275 [Patescibacteria group bacterium]|nr:hypothetical protein [Patescibacteria group bacterium]
MLTKRQKQVFDFITSYHKKRGYSPSLKEICKRFDLASVSTAHFHVKKLQGLGLLEKQYNKPRSIALHENVKKVLTRKKCPACGQKEDPDGRCLCVNRDAW